MYKKEKDAVGNLSTFQALEQQMVERQRSETFAEIPPKHHRRNKAKMKDLEEDEDAQIDEMRKYAALFKIKINQKNLDALGDEISKAYEKDVLNKKSIPQTE